MTLDNLQKIAPHAVIVILILVVCFFVARPFVDDSILSYQSNTTKLSKTTDTNLGKLIEDIFESSQLATFVSIEKKLPIVKQREVTEETFENIQREGDLGNVGRRNPFSQF